MVLKTLRTQQKTQSRWLTWMVSVPQPLDGNVLCVLCVPQTGSWLFLWCRFFKAPFEALGMQRAEHFCSVNQVREREQDALKNKNIQGNIIAGWVLPCCQEFHVQTSPAVPVIIILIFFFLPSGHSHNEWKWWGRAAKINPQSSKSFPIPSPTKKQDLILPSPSSRVLLCRDKNAQKTISACNLLYFQTLPLLT